MTRSPDAVAEHARRVYFEQLSALLLARGVDGARIGAMVEELDGHLEIDGGDPVGEFGPVGELAGAMADAVSHPSPWLWLAGNAVIAIAISTAIAMFWALVVDGSGSSGDDVTIRLGFIAYVSVFTIGMVLVRQVGCSGLIGRARLEGAVWKSLLPFVVLVAVVQAVTANLEWTVARSTAVVLLLVSTLAAIALAVWSIRRSRIPIDGRINYLRRLHWGPIGMLR
jgi:hypothetical protein